MRVGLVCPYSLDVPGGVQSHVRDLAGGLRARGHEVQLLAPGRTDRTRPSYTQTIGPAVPVPFNGSVARLAFGPRALLATRAWLRAGAFDVVHVHEPATPSLGLIAAWASDRPVVATFHTAISPSAPTAALQRIVRPVLERVSVNVAVSEAARRSMAANRTGEPTIVPNGIDFSAFSTAEPRSRWSAPSPTIAFLGRWEEPRKGLRVLLAALGRIRSEFPTARLLVGGPGRSRRRRASERPVVGVDFLGELSDLDRAELLASADVFVAPNIGGESFGIVLVEAMAAGAPVVASDLPAFAAVLEGGRAGRLFATGDPAAAAAAVVEVLSSPDRAAELRAHGQAAAKSYDWSRVVPAIESVYERAVLRSS
jgi:phosphatidyl-myo-inositol alpha-mannosyltransferase